jgi:hypothetical protein
MLSCGLTFTYKGSLTDRLTEMSDGRQSSRGWGDDDGSQET